MLDSLRSLILHEAEDQHEYTGGAPTGSSADMGLPTILGGSRRSQGRGQVFAVFSLQSLPARGMQITGGFWFRDQGEGASYIRPRGPRSNRNLLASGEDLGSWFWR